MRGDVHQFYGGSKLLCVQVSTEDTDALGLVCIVPLSGNVAPAPWRTPVQINDQTMRALPEQVNTVALHRLGPKVATLSADDLAAIGTSLRAVLDL